MNINEQVTRRLVSRQSRLFDCPIVGLYQVSVDEANVAMHEWGHQLGECHRPFHQEAFSLQLGERPLAYAISASIVNGPVGPQDGSVSYGRTEVVELARLVASERWANRVMLRLWRETCARLWPCWPVKAAVSYSHNGMHTGDLYRFDGWERWRTDAGSTGGGTWGRKRSNTEAVYGKKTLWGWRYGTQQEEGSDE